MKIRRRQSIAALLVAGMLVLVACGSDNSSSSTGAPTTTAAAAVTSAASAVTSAASAATSAASAATTASPQSTSASTPAPTGSVIKVGVVGSTSGTGAVNDPGMSGVLSAWEQWTNAHGGIAGHPVKAIFADDGSDGAKGLAAVRDLVENQHVVALAGVISVFSESAWADYVKQNNIPVVGGDISTGIWQTNPMFFSTVIQPQYGAIDSTTNAAARGYKTIHEIVCAEAEICSTLDKLIQGSAQALGLTLVPYQKAAFTDPNYIAQCTNAQGANVDYLALSLPSAEVGRVMSDCLSQGYSPTFHVQHVAITRALADVKGVHMFGGVQTVPWFYQGPENKDLRDAMDKYNGGTNNKDWQAVYSSVTWGGLEMFKKAVELAKPTGDVTNQTVLNGLYMVKGENLGGLLPNKVTYQQAAPTFVGGCDYILELKDGQFTMPQQLTPLCPKLAS
jgi:branched-chain amino acid transport system substrate-binding protein